MGAGLGKEREYRIVYRELHKIQRDLAAKGVQARYKKSSLYGEKAEGDIFIVRFRRINASNGECSLWPTAAIKVNDRTSLYNEAPWMPGPSWKTAEPLIVEHFAQK
jgi:hypothetical protein